MLDALLGVSAQHPHPAGESPAGLSRRAPSDKSSGAGEAQPGARDSGTSPAAAASAAAAHRERSGGDIHVAERLRAQDIEALKRLIIDQTEGNPFFMEEVVQALFEAGALVSNGGVHLTRPLDALKVPPTVQAILQSRIDRLPAAEKELLQTVAVIGKKFPLSLARAVIKKAR